MVFIICSYLKDGYGDIYFNKVYKGRYLSIIINDSLIYFLLTLTLHLTIICFVVK